MQKQPPQHLTVLPSFLFLRLFKIIGIIYIYKVLFLSLRLHCKYFLLSLTLMHLCNNCITIISVCCNLHNQSPNEDRLDFLFLLFSTSNHLAIYFPEYELVVPFQIISLGSITRNRAFGSQGDTFGT